MATIIQFPAERVSRDAGEDGRANGKTAELLFFTGVRYSRHDGGPVRAGNRAMDNSGLEKRTV